MANNEPVTWSVTVATQPTVEPVTVAEAKAQRRFTSSSEDDLFAQYIAAARLMVEEATGRTFYQTTRALHLDRFPTRGVILLPYRPLIAVSSVAYLDTDGASQTVSASDYVVDSASRPPRICPAAGSAWPSTYDQPAAVTVTYTCGYAVADSATLEAERARGRQAVLLLVAHWHQNREATISGTIVTSTPLGFDALVGSEADNPYLMAEMI